MEKGRNLELQKYSHLYIGILNEYDLIASKLIRGTSVDIDDCTMLVKSRKNINIKQLRAHYEELIQYQFGTEKQLKTDLDQFLSKLQDEGII